MKIVLSAPVPAFTFQFRSGRQGEAGGRGVWGEWIPRIEEVDRENSVFEIDLPADEWERLKKEDMASLKSRLSEGAAGRLMLLEDDDRKYLLVAHYGRCP